MSSDRNNESATSICTVRESVISLPIKRLKELQKFKQLFPPSETDNGHATESWIIREM
jgi:hypothetical protein